MVRQDFVIFTTCFLLCQVLFVEGKGILSVCSPRWPGTHYVDYAGLELSDSHLPQPLESRLKGLFTPGVVVHAFNSST